MVHIGRVDIELSNAEALGNIFKKFRKDRKRRKEENEEVNGQREGSIVDMLLQNNPWTNQILQKPDLGLVDYQIISQDFNKTFTGFQLQVTNNQVFRNQGK